MPSNDSFPSIGRVLNSSAVGYCYGCSAPQPNIPALGAFVSTLGGGSASILGVISDIRVVDDMFARQLVSETTAAYAIQDQQTFRMVPLEVDVLHAGYFLPDGTVRHRLPPQPPVALESVRLCPPEEVRAFLKAAQGGWKFSFLTLLLAAGASNEVLSEVVWRMAETQPPDTEPRVRQEAARELTRLLAGDLQRLYALLPQLSQ
jgi:hypothetical protein